MNIFGSGLEKKVEQELESFFAQSRSLKSAVRGSYGAKIMIIDEGKDLYSMLRFVLDELGVENAPIEHFADFDLARKYIEKNGGLSVRALVINSVNAKNKTKDLISWTEKNSFGFPVWICTHSKELSDLAQKHMNIGIVKMSKEGVMQCLAESGLTTC